MTKIKVFKKKRRGQAMVETVLIFPVLLLLILGIIQLALLGKAMIILNDAAFAAARAAAVGRSANLAAAFIIQPTLGLDSGQGIFSGVSVSTKKISAAKYAPPLIPGSWLYSTSNNSGLKTVTATVTYMYKPMYAKIFAPGLGYIPIRVSARIMKEPEAPPAN